MQSQTYLKNSHAKLKYFHENEIKMKANHGLVFFLIRQLGEGISIKIDPVKYIRSEILHV